MAMTRAQRPSPWEDRSDKAELLKVLGPFLQSRRYRSGQILWNEGDASGELLLLEHGRIKAVRIMPDGTAMLLFVFSEGDLFGFLPFIDGGPYPATAIVVDDVEARVMSRSHLQRAILENPKIAMVLLDALGRRLRQAFDRLGDQSQKNSITRVAAALLLLLPPGKHRTVEIIDIPHPIHGFATDIGMTPETFSRAVTQLVETGVLHRLAPPRLQVLDPKRLRSIASGHSADGLVL